MNLDKFLVSDQPHERQVTLPDGSQETLYFLQPTAAGVRRWHAAETGNDIHQKLYSMQELIAASLYDPKLQRRAFDDPNHPNKHQQLSYKACECLLAPILELAGVTDKKKPKRRGDISA